MYDLFLWKSWASLFADIGRSGDSKDKEEKDWREELNTQLNQEEEEDIQDHREEEIENLELEADMVEALERTLRQLAEPDMTQQPLCVVYPKTTVPFELKQGLIHLLPQFSGNLGHDPNKHLKDFYLVSNSMKPH